MGVLGGAPARRHRRPGWAGARAAVGAAAAALVLAGCYSPSVRDCTVSCAAPGDCAAGQVCGADGLCAAPALAGQCGAPAPDAAPRPDDAGPHGGGPPHDAGRPDGGKGGPRPDASEVVQVHVQITGKGSVFLDGTGVCTSLDPQKGSCTYELASGVAQAITAIQLERDQPFAAWTSAACSGQGARCVFTPVADTSVVAQFVHTKKDVAAP